MKSRRMKMESRSSLWVYMMWRDVHDDSLIRKGLLVVKSREVIVHEYSASSIVIFGASLWLLKCQCRRLCHIHNHPRQNTPRLTRLLFADCREHKIEPSLFGLVCWNTV